MSEKANNLKQLLLKNLSLIFVVLVIIFFSLATNRFFTRGNIKSILMEWAILSTLAVGFTFVVVAAEFDLSFGYLIGLCSVVAALLTNLHIGFFFMLIIVLLIGLAVGTINGLLITRMGIPAFLTTIGMGAICQGTNYFFSGAAAIPIRTGALPKFFIFLGQKSILNLPALLLLTIPIAAIAFYLLNHTRFGQHLYIIGINPDAAKKVGVSIKNGKLVAMMMSGLSAAIVGLIITSRTNSGQAPAGPEYLIDVFASVFFGMSLFKGGQANIGGSLVGAFFIVIISNGLRLMNMPFYYHMIATGIVILIGLGMVSLLDRQDAKNN